MKSLPTFCLAVLTMASFQASAELNAAKIIGTILNAIPQQQPAPARPAPATPPAATGGAVPSAPPAATANSKVDWTPLFKSWERGCGGNPTLDAFTMGLEDGKIVLPSPYRESVGKLTKTKKSREVTIRLPMSGTYYGLPVKGFERYYVEETGMNGYELVLAVPKAAAQKTLARVAYRPDPEADFKAMVSSSGQDAALSCDTSM